MDRTRVLLDFLQQHSVMVLSTVTSDSKSESALVEFCETENLELIFDTFTTFRKFGNLKANRYVSCVIGAGEQTVQYEGVATELQENDIEVYKSMYFSKLPAARKFEDAEGICYFKLTPKWIRFTDVSVDPWDVFELNF